MKFLRKLKAFIYRTFVTDCPACYIHFYGHQSYKTSVKLNGRNYRIICHRCAVKPPEKLPEPNLIQSLNVATYAKKAQVANPNPSRPIF